MVVSLPLCGRSPIHTDVDFRSRHIPHAAATPTTRQRMSHKRTSLGEDCAKLGITCHQLGADGMSQSPTLIGLIEGKKLGKHSVRPRPSTKNNCLRVDSRKWPKWLM